MPTNKNVLQLLLANYDFVDAVLVRETEDEFKPNDGHPCASLDGEEMLPVLVLDFTDDETDLIPDTLARVTS